MINWSEGVTARYYATVVDPSTWQDISSFDISGGSIKYSDSGVRESADLNCSNISPDNEFWMRIYFDVEQGSNHDRVPLFTGLASIPDSSWTGKFNTSNLQCYSVLSVTEKVLLPLGWYAPAGANGARTIKDLLSDATPAPIIIDGVSPSLSQSVVAENGESKLSMVDKILTAIDWRIKISGNGTITICDIADDISANFNYLNNDIIEMDVQINRNMHDIPNVFQAINNDMISVARDEDPTSPFSIVNRGREIWMQETNCVLNNGEKIGEYAHRRLREEQKLYRTISYNRRFLPGIRPTDMVAINYPEQKINGIFEVQSQTLDLAYGGRISEQVYGL